MTATWEKYLKQIQENKGTQEAFLKSIQNGKEKNRMD